GGALEPELHARPGVDGTLRPVHDVGLPLILAPYVRLLKPLVTPLLGVPDHPVLKRFRLTPSTAYRHLLSAFMIIVAATLAREMFKTFLLVETQPSLAFWTALVVSLSPPLLIFSILTFTELMSALVCLVLFRYLVLEDRRELWPWVGAGALIGFLLLLHVRSVGLVAILLILASRKLARQQSIQNVAAFLTPLSLIVGVRIALNYQFWGTYLTNPHARLGPTSIPDNVHGALHRSLAMLLDQEFGLLPYAPIFGLVPLGGVILWRRSPALSAQLLAVVVFYLLPICLPFFNVHGWTGGWSPPGRFLMPIIPLLGIAVYAAMAATSRAVIAPLLLLQIIANAYFWQNPKTLWNDGDGIAAVCERHDLGVCRLLPSFPEL
ncbi:MAG TPA: hypothetical protein VGD94_22695, partial [Vicinamibacterales bacterium]